MDIITKEEFKELIGYSSECCISIYMPAHRSGVAVNEKQDPIILKNQLQAAAAELRSKGLTGEKIDSLLQQGYELYNNEIFWNSQLDGLAVFIGDDFFKVVQLPFEVKEELYINNSFLVSPLLPAISNNEQFYLLVLSKHDARFYQGSAFGLQYIEVEGLPNGMDDVVHFEEKEGRQLNRAGNGSGSERGANQHGHGEGQPGDKENIAIYFQEVDKTLFTEILHDKHAPLVLAGVEYLIPIYKSISKYKNIAAEPITGNHEHDGLNALFVQAREKVAPYFAQEVNKALQNYYNQIATSLTSSMPEKVVPASYYAQVSDLFICKDEHVWGTFDEAENKLVTHTEKQQGDDCLLNKAAIQTFVNGGSVYLLDSEKMPKESIIAASLRF
jgi:hypothetical protein